MMKPWWSRLLSCTGSQENFMPGAGSCWISYSAEAMDQLFSQGGNGRRPLTGLNELYGVGRGLFGVVAGTTVNQSKSSVCIYNVSMVDVWFHYNCSLCTPALFLFVILKCADVQLDEPRIFFFFFFPHVVQLASLTCDWHVGSLQLTVTCFRWGSAPEKCNCKTVDCPL